MPRPYRTRAAILCLSLKSEGPCLPTSCSCGQKPPLESAGEPYKRPETDQIDQGRSDQRRGIGGVALGKPRCAQKLRKRDDARQRGEVYRLQNVAGQVGKQGAYRLRPDDVGGGLGRAHSGGARCLNLTARDALDSGAEDLAEISRR